MPPPIGNRCVNRSHAYRHRASPNGRLSAATKAFDGARRFRSSADLLQVRDDRLIEPQSSGQLSSRPFTVTATFRASLNGLGSRPRGASHRQAQIPMGRNPQRLPEALSRAEVAALLALPIPPKARTFLTLAYASGLRLRPPTACAFASSGARAQFPNSTSRHNRAGVSVQRALSDANGIGALDPFRWTVR